MKFKETKECFLSAKPIPGYESNLNDFWEHIKSKGISDKTLKEYLQGIRTKAINESLNFYIDSRNVSSIDTAQRYVSAVKEYLQFMIDEGIMDNNALVREMGYPIYSEKSFRFQINKAISENEKLSKGDSFIAFEEKEKVEPLIKDCDETLKIGITKAISKKKYYNSFLSALIIKLILLTGIAYREILKLSISNYSPEFNTLTANSFTIHLPVNLSKQFRQYCDVRKQLLINNSKSSEILFIEYNTARLSRITAKTSMFLAGLTGRNDLNGLIKYAIIEMIKKGINESIIKKFTGVGDKIFNDCQEFVNQQQDENATRYLDSKIRSLRIWDLL